VFDFRYHVASLAAVFVALVIGILVGIGLSGRGFVNDAERSVLQGQIDDLKAQRDAGATALDEAERRGFALDDYSKTTYPSLVRGRLRDRKLAVLFVGPLDRGMFAAIDRAVRDAGGSITRVRAIAVPLDPAVIARALPPASRREYVGQGHWEALGKVLGREYVMGGPTPVWDALTDALVVVLKGAPHPAVDGVVIARTAHPQRGATKEFLSGLYQGLAGAGEPAVGAETAAATISAVPAFRRGGLSTVDSVESAAGRLAVILLLAGGRPGSYGVEDAAVDGVLPPVAR
jgi:Copper transport outer membrane protein, MctB